LPAQPIADAVLDAPVIASFSALGAQSVFFGVTRRKTIVADELAAAAVEFGTLDEWPADLLRPPSHADKRHATTSMPIKGREAGALNDT
jgi:hypothetical protein